MSWPEGESTVAVHEGGLKAGGELWRVLQGLEGIPDAAGGDATSSAGLSRRGARDGAESAVVSKCDRDAACVADRLGRREKNPNDSRILGRPDFEPESACSAI